MHRERNGFGSFHEFGGCLMKWGSCRKEFGTVEEEQDSCIDVHWWDHKRGGPPSSGLRSCCEEDMTHTVKGDEKIKQSKILNLIKDEEPA